MWRGSWLPSGPNKNVSEASGGDNIVACYLAEHPTQCDVTISVARSACPVCRACRQSSINTRATTQRALRSSPIVIASFVLNFATLHVDPVGSRFPCASLPTPTRICLILIDNGRMFYFRKDISRTAVLTIYIGPCCPLLPCRASPSYRRISIPLCTCHSSVEQGGMPLHQPDLRPTLPSCTGHF